MNGKLANFFGVITIILVGLPSYAFANNGLESMIELILITLLIIIVVFLILREVVCWYWKINETLSVLKEIRDLLKSSEGFSENPKKTWDCPKCNCVNKNTTYSCRECGYSLR